MLYLPRKPQKWSKKEAGGRRKRSKYFRTSRRPQRSPYAPAPALRTLLLPAVQAWRALGSAGTRASSCQVPSELSAHYHVHASAHLQCIAAEQPPSSTSGRALRSQGPGGTRFRKPVKQLNGSWHSACCCKTAAERVPTGLPACLLAFSPGSQVPATHDGTAKLPESSVQRRQTHTQRWKVSPECSQIRESRAVAPNFDLLGILLPSPVLATKRAACPTAAAHASSAKARRENATTGWPRCQGHHRQTRTDGKPKQARSSGPLARPSSPFPGLLHRTWQQPGCCFKHARFAFRTAAPAVSGRAIRKSICPCQCRPFNEPHRRLHPLSPQSVHRRPWSCVAVAMAIKLSSS